MADASGGLPPRPPSQAVEPGAAAVDVGPGLPRHAGVPGYASDSDFESDYSSQFDAKNHADTVNAGALKAALEVDITSDEFEWLASGALPKVLSPTAADALETSIARRSCWPRPLFTRLVAPFGRSATGERYVLFNPATEDAAHRAHRVFRGRSVLCGLPLLSPFSLAARGERVLVTFLDCTYSAFFVPIAIAYIGPGEWSRWGALSGVDLVAGFIFTADIAFSFARAAVVTHNFRRRLLADGRLVARAYAMHGTLWLDTITVVPFWAQMVTLCVARAKTATAINVLLGLRALRLLRVIPALARLYELAAGDLSRSLAGVVSTTFVYLATLIYTAAVLFNLLSCVWFFVARIEGAFNTPPAETWLDNTLGDVKIHDLKPYQQYVAGAYFSVTTLTTVGYGDITPKSTAEHGLAILVMFIGVLFFGFIVSSLSATLANSSAASRRAATLRLKFEEVESWARARRLPPPLRRRIMEYYASVWVRKEEWREADLYSELPPGLRADVTRTLALELFRASDLFSGVPDALLHDLAAAMAPVTVFPGHDLCEQGEAADGLWLMHEGELLLLRDGVPVDVVHAPALLGECVILADRVPEAARRPVTMRAVELCTLWALPASRLRLLLDRCPDVEARVVADFKDHVRRYAARARRAASGSGANTGMTFSLGEAVGAGLADMLAQVEAAAADTRAEIARERARSRRSKPRGSSSRAESGPLDGGTDGLPSVTPSADPSAHAGGSAVPPSPFASFGRPSAGLPSDAAERAAALAGADSEVFAARGAGLQGSTTWPSPAPGLARTSAGRPNLARLSSTAVRAPLPHGLERRSLVGLHHARSDRDTSAHFLVGEFARQGLPAARARAAAARAGDPGSARGAPLTGLGRRSSLADEFIAMEMEEEEARRATQA